MRWLPRLAWLAALVVPLLVFSIRPRYKGSGDTIPAELLPISVLEHGIIDAVVLDVRMPRRSGLELLEFIRLDKHLHGFPVLILTGAALTPGEEAAIARESAYVFYKSENLDALALQLDQLTG